MRPQLASIARARDYLRTSNYIGAITRLTGSTAIAQLLALIVSPLLTRLYTPDDFGVVAFYASVITVAGIIATLRYEMAIPLTKDDSSAVALLVAVIAVVVSMTGISALAAWIVSTGIRINHLQSLLGKYLWTIPLGLFWLGVNQIFTFWAIRTKQYSALSRTRITQATGRLSLQLIWGYTIGGPLGLILGDIVGRAFGCSRLVSSAMSIIRRELGAISYTQAKKQLKHYSKFPLITLPGNILNIASLQILPIFLLAAYGPNVAGFFALTQRVLYAPMNMIGSSVSQVYMAEAADLLAKEPSQVPILFRKTVLGLLVFAIVPTITLIAFGPVLFSYIFGTHWTDSGVLARIMSAAFMTQMIASPVSQTLNVLQRQSTGLVGDAVRLTGTLFILTAAYYYSIDFYTTMIAMSGFLSLSYIVYLWIYYREVTRYSRARIAEGNTHSS